MVGCEGCMPGKRHYRKSAPKALCKPGALQCRFCMVCAAVPAACDVVMPHATEQRFMWVVWGRGGPTILAPVHGFLQPRAGVPCSGMYKHKCEEVLGADFEQARRAVVHSATMVRVHEADLSCDCAVEHPGCCQFCRGCAVCKLHDSHAG